MLRRSIPYLKVTFAVLVWGASFIATKLALQEISPVTVVWTRFGIGVFVLAVANLWSGRMAWPKRVDLLYFAFLGFLGISFHQWLQSTGLVTSQASTTAWIVATTPIFMALLGWLVLGEKLTWGQWAGIGLAALGVLLVVSEGDLVSVFRGSFGRPGDFLIVLSAPNWAVFSTLSRKGLQRHPAVRMMLFVMASGWLFTSGMLWAGPGLSEFVQLTWQGWGALLFLGVACSGLAYIFWYDSLQHLPASQVGAFLYLEPLVAVVVAGLLLSEPIIWTALLGGAIILLGVWLVNRKPQTA